MMVTFRVKLAILAALLLGSPTVLRDILGLASEEEYRDENGSCAWSEELVELDGNGSTSRDSLNEAAATTTGADSAAASHGSDTTSEERVKEQFVMVVDEATIASVKTFADTATAAPSVHGLEPFASTIATDFPAIVPTKPLRMSSLETRVLEEDGHEEVLGLGAANTGEEANVALDPAFQSSIAAPASTQAGKPVAMVVSEDLAVDEIMLLLQQARLAVARLEVEVTRQERRLAELTGAAAVGTWAPVAAAAAPTGVSVAAMEPAVAAATAAVLHTLGMDGSSNSATVRQALREALLQVLQNLTVGSSTEELVSGASGSRPIAYTTGSGAGVAPEDWFGRHFGVRAASRLTPPPPISAATAPSADGPALAADPMMAAPATITCVFPYELPHPNAAASGGGTLQYIVVGDATGLLYIVSPNDGTVMVAVHTGTDSAVTACSAFSVRRYESTVVTGHANGQTRSFAVVLHEIDGVANEGASEGISPPTSPPPASPPPLSRDQQRLQSKQRQRQGDGRTKGAGKVVVQSLRLRHVVESMPPGALPWAAVDEFPMTPGVKPASPRVGIGRSQVTEEVVAGGQGEEATEPQYTGPPAPVMHILPYRLGNKVTGRRHLLVLDRAGNLRLDRDNGTLRFWARTNRTQLAARFVGSHVVMLSAYHATLMNTLQPRQPRAYPCHHLNGSRLLVASFDGHRSFRGYGINGRGELLSMVTPHEGGLATCKVHRATPLPWLDPKWLSDPASSHSMSLTPLRGYLMLTHGSQRVVFNVTGIVRTGIPILTSSSDDVIADVANTMAGTPTDAAAASVVTGRPLGPSAGHLVGGMLPPPPAVAVSPGSQVVILAPSLSPAAAQQQPIPGLDEHDTRGGGAVLGPLLVILDTNMPRPQISGGTSKIWSQPVFLAAMLLVGLYQFWRMSNARNQRRSMPSASRSNRGRRGYGAGYGGNSHGDAAEYMYGEDRVPLQPRSALRRGRLDRPMGRTVSYEDDDY